MKLEIVVATVLIVAIVLIVVGTLGLAYEGFTLTSDRYIADLGLAELSVNGKTHFNAPVLAGVFAIVAGGVLFVWH